MHRPALTTAVAVPQEDGDQSDLRGHMPNNPAGRMRTLQGQVEMMADLSTLPNEAFRAAFVGDLAEFQ